MSVLRLASPKSPNGIDATESSKFPNRSYVIRNSVYVHCADVNSHPGVKQRV